MSVGSETGAIGCVVPCCLAVSYVLSLQAGDIKATI